MKVLVLDFDGVISDSAPECFWVALRTLLQVRPSPMYEGELASLVRLEGPAARESIVGNPLFQKFLDLMPLGNRAEDFGVALLAIEAGESLDDQAAYDDFFSRLDASFARDFHRHFYRERQSFRGAQPGVWDALVMPFEGLVQVLHRHAGDVALAIATAKDGDSVARLLENYGIAGLFADGAVVDKESGRDKRAHLRTLATRFGVDFNEMTFIDDKANHLMQTQQLGVRCLLAEWGYNGEREHVVARGSNIEVVALSDLESCLFD